MPKSVGRTKKRRFAGNQHDKRLSKNSCESNGAVNTASSSKLSDCFSSELEGVNKFGTGHRVLDLDILINVFSKLPCPKCYSCELQLSEDSRFGLCSHFSMKCKNCDFHDGFASSKKTLNVAEVNSRFVYGMRQIGKGFSAAYKLCSTMNMPVLSKAAYKDYEGKLMTAVSEVAKESMLKAADDIARNTENDECGVSVDGTWQRRGHTSLNGCVAAVSVDTGKVVDIEVMSSYCPTCKKLERMSRDATYESLKADHICHCNFEGSSSKMETVGALRIFGRSLDSRKLKYTQYFGDGDSKGFLSVKNIYGNNTVTKMECIGHVQKRVGSRLRKLKSKTKGISGKGKLTDAFIDRLQNYYGIAIRSNVGNLQSMQQNVIAALFHCASSNKKPMHGQCPVGKESWCFYQRALACGTSVKKQNPGLPNNILNTVKPIYLELCSRELLSKCIHGKTQNANESLNGIIWQRVPKETFVCLKTLKLGAYDAVVQFNDGFKGCLAILNKLNIKTPGFYTLNGYQHLDRDRIIEAGRHSTPVAKNRRKLLKALRKKN